MITRELFGRLSLAEEDSPNPKLLLDDIPVKEGQILIVKYGESKPIVGRAQIHPKRREWYLSTLEFYRHTYFDLPIKGNFIFEMIAQIYTKEH